jgi:hypothetical protein
MKELHEIERDYIEGIISFFCRKSMEVFGIKNNSSSFDIKYWIDNHIRKRLIETNLIYDYMVKVNIYNISDIRDYRINKVLGNDFSEPRNNIVVSIKYGTREMETFQYFIN